jgi:hypothetical protein
MLNLICIYENGGGLQLSRYHLYALASDNYLISCEGSNVDCVDYASSKLVEFIAFK